MSAHGIRTARRWGFGLSGVLCFLLAGCTAADDVSWSQYNATDDSVTIEVGSAEVLEPVSVDLTSNTGAVALGTGTVSPGGGPVGTLHTITVVVDDAYASDIGRVSARLDSGDRGEDEYDLDADATGEGYWVLELTSVGSADEVRSDTLTFRLWTDAEDSG